MYCRNKLTDSELKKVTKKKFVRLDEGAKLYSVGVNTFREWAKDANAIYRIKTITLINTELVDQFLETFREGNDYV